jgi:5-methylcytosine-specific restriction protein B
MPHYSKNHIFYGPPGTGKTYSTVGKAIEILDPDYYKNNKSNRAELKKRFDVLKAAGSIDVVTFHQSFSYEEFVEGIRASTTDSGEIFYEIEDGVFKTCAVKAGQRRIWPLFPSGTLVGSYEVISHSLETIVLLTPKNHTKLPFSTIIIELLAEEVIAGHIVSSDINKESDWVKKIEPVVDQGVVQSYRHIIRPLVDLYVLHSQGQVKNSPQILIIDEINRGNISNIFGELITLIEESKRIGAADETTVRLPYSKSVFGVPNNLYIIGTMNTADRSLTLIDTALRRRFTFEEIAPNASLLAGIIFSGVNIEELFRTMNRRIQLLYDREHVLGHAYFLNLRMSQSIETLAQIFESQIIPLLQEYFFDDLEKVRLVLNDSAKDPKYQFLIRVDHDEIELEKLGLEPAECAQFEFNSGALLFAESYQMIYE